MVKRKKRQVKWSVKRDHSPVATDVSRSSGSRTGGWTAQCATCGEALEHGYTGTMADRWSHYPVVVES